ncbi:hypothetical protein RB195_012051 [Necator americanus]|uniref:Reverse transcriptase domain-containing protein n=1 Tax=Necator americanus TaxID=51031 RepID=A0ABR1D5A4_NECAM
MLAKSDETCKKIGVQLNLGKTMSMRNRRVSDASSTVNGRNISECSSYGYLDREINMMSDLDLKVCRRKRAAWGTHESIEEDNSGEDQEHPAPC